MKRSELVVGEHYLNCGGTKWMLADDLDDHRVVLLDAGVWVKSTARTHLESPLGHVRVPGERIDEAAHRTGVVVAPVSGSRVDLAAARVVFTSAIAAPWREALEVAARARLQEQMDRARRSVSARKAEQLVAAARARGMPSGDVEVDGDAVRLSVAQLEWLVESVPVSVGVSA